MTPRYPTVCVRVDAAEAELAGAALFELGATGLEERDETTLERSLGKVELVAHFSDEAAAQAALAAVPDRWEAALRFIVGDAWRERWKEFFKPARVAERLVVRPPWEAFDPGPDDLVITLDPGQAFGTGTHETTRLVMREIERIGARGEVLDVGCGSGILSIAALLCGASRAVATDIDPIAARVALENAEVNEVTIEASTTPIEDIEGTFELVVANIRSPILIPMAGALAARTAGHLVLSGLLVEERDEVRAAFDTHLRFERERIDGEWLSLTYETSS